MPERASDIAKYHGDLHMVRKEISKVVIGQETVVETLLKALMVNGHVLVEGVPGVAKTLILKALALTTGCSFQRIQFTIDLLPSDITGVSVYDKVKGFYILKGPIFSNFVLADEINRASPKTQAALLEAMQEKQVTIARQTFPIQQPFFVMATQNPIENMGVYELPEAQLDRFLFKAIITYPSTREEEDIIDQNTDVRSLESYRIKPVLSPQKILELQARTRQIFLSDNLKKYIVRLVDATRHPQKYDIQLGRYVEFGASPRASVSIASASRAEALLRGCTYVTDRHIRNVIHDILRHRIILSYEGLATKVTTEEIIDEILSKAEVIS